MTDRLPDIMSEDEWRSFIETFNLKAPTGLRNAAMFTLMHDAGLRTCEVVGLRASDIHTDELDGAEVTCLHLHHTKGDRERVVYLTEEADELLRRWLDVKRDKGLARYRTVFTTLKGTPVASSYLREVAARKGAEAGIEWRVHPHALRHTFATDLLEDTGDLALVQDALGHADPATTRIYAKVRNGRLATAMTRRRQRQEADPVEDIDEDTLRLARALQEAPDEVREALSAVLGEEG